MYTWVGFLYKKMGQTYNGGKHADGTAMFICEAIAVYCSK